MVVLPAANAAASLCASRLAGALNGVIAVGEGGVAHAAGPAGHRQDLATDVPGLGGRDGEGVGDPQDLGAAVLDRFAELQGEQPGEVVAAAQRFGGRAAQDVGAGGR